MTFIKPIALVLAVLIILLVAGILIIIAPIVLPESRPFYVRAYRSLRHELSYPSITGR